MRYSESFAENGNLPSGYKEAYTNSPDYGAAVGGAEGSGTFYGKLSQSSFKFACSCNLSGQICLRSDRRNEAGLMK